MTVTFEQRIETLQGKSIDADSAEEFARLDFDMLHSAEKISAIAQEQLEQLRTAFANAKLECKITCEKIQPENFFTIGGNFFDVNALLGSILSQDEIQNPYTRQPLTPRELTKLCAHFNICVTDFQALWSISAKNLHQHNAQMLAKLRTDAEKSDYLVREGLPEYEANYKRDVRKKLFKDLFEKRQLTFSRILKIAAVTLLAIAVLYFLQWPFPWNIRTSEIITFQRFP